MEKTQINAAINSLSPIIFENLVFDFVQTAGISNLVWRTPGADGGRDIEGIYIFADPTGERLSQKWYIECKRYTSSAIDWPTVFEKISYSVVDSSDVLWLITSSKFSTQCLTKISEWNKQHIRPKIRAWAIHDLAGKIVQHHDLCLKYDLPTKSPNLEHVLFELMTISCKAGNAIANSAAANIPIKRHLNRFAQCINDLIFRRIESINKHSKFTYSEFTLPSDELKPITNISHTNVSCLDSTGLRSVLSVILLHLKDEAFNIEISHNTCRLLILPSRLPDTAKSQMEAICKVSNFNINYEMPITIWRAV